MVSIHYYAASPVLAVHRYAGSDLFMPESLDASMHLGCGRASGARPAPVAAVPPSQNYLAKAHFPVAGRKRRADDADLEDGDLQSPARDTSPSAFGSRSEARTGRSARKIACIGRSSVPEAADSSLEQLRQHLGISWKPLSSDVVAASNGWARYIQNHFPVGSVQILLRNESWKAFFVRTSADGSFGSNVQYYLFQESLVAGRHISHSLEIAMQKLTHWSQMLVHGSSWSPLSDTESLVYASPIRLCQYQVQSQVQQSYNPMVACGDDGDVEMN